MIPQHRPIGGAKLQAIVTLLVAHGDEDKVVPYPLGRALFAAAGDPNTSSAFREPITMTCSSR